MHHALEIREILVEIIEHCGLVVTPVPGPMSVYYLHKKAIPDLAALARTCRTFKEPALDALWRVLLDLSPLARCLPGASHQTSPGNRVMSSRNFAVQSCLCNEHLLSLYSCRSVEQYSFIRRLTQTDWDILQSYTRRVRSICGFDDGLLGLTSKSIKALTEPPAADGPLFPNLHTLHCTYTKKTTYLLRIPLPALVALNITLEDPHLLHSALQSFMEVSPRIERLSIHLDVSSGMPFEVDFRNIICCWHLSSLVCPEVAINVNVLLYLSHMPTLTKLSFALGATFLASDSAFIFSNLRDLTVRSECLPSISRLLGRTQLPAITDFITFINDWPSKQELSSFFASIQTCASAHVLETLYLIQGSDVPMGDHLRSESSPLGLEDLRPCMVFPNLRHMNIDVQWNVGLTDGQLLTLASAWPRLEHLQINASWGWNAPLGGITPGGLLRLWQPCPSLSRVGLALDTRGYTTSPPEHAPANRGLRLPPALSLNVIDSVIKRETVPAVVDFFSGIAAHTDLAFTAWDCRSVGWGNNEYLRRWNDVYGQMAERPEVRVKWWTFTVRRLMI